MKDQERTVYRGNRPRDSLALRAWHAGSPRERALEPGLPIVDAHHHLYGGTADTHFYRLEDLEQDLGAGHKVIGTVYVEAYASGWHTSGPLALRSLGEVEMITRLNRSPVRIAHGSCQLAAAVISNVDLTLGDGVAEVLETHMQAGQGRLRGVRHHVTYVDGLVGSLINDPPKQHLMADPAFRRGFAWLDRFGLSFDALIYHPQLGELADLADAFPETRIVLNHVAAVIGVAEFRSYRASVLAGWQRGMRALAARPNVCVKIGGMGMPVFGFGFEGAERPATSDALVRAWQPFIDVCIDAFGPHRCMFESNFPVDKQSCGYTELWNAFKLATCSCTQDERRELFYRTACRTYRLPELQKAGDLAS
jgi:L-fuconolactonase